MIVVLVATPAGDVAAPALVERWLEAVSADATQVLVLAPVECRLGDLQHVAAGPGSADLLGACADICAQATSTVVLVSTHSLVDGPGLAELLGGAGRSSALIQPLHDGDLRVVRGTVTGARSSVHPLDEATHSFAGAFAVHPDDLAAAEFAWREMAAVVRDNGWDDVDVMQLLLVALTRLGVRLHGLDIDPSDRHGSASPYTTHVVQPLAQPVIDLALRWGIGRRSTIIVSFAVAVAAAALAAAGTRLSLVLAALLVQLWVVLDLVEQELQPEQPEAVPFTSWLASVLGRFKELILVLGLAVGAAVFGDDVWLTAAISAALLAFLHFATAAHQVLIDSWVDDRPVLLPLDEVTHVPSAPRRRNLRGHVDEGRDSSPSPRWVAAAMSTPTRELYLVLSVVMVIVGWEAALVTLAVWSSAAILYTNIRWLPDSLEPLPTARRLRARRDQHLLEQSDPGVLAALVARQDAQLSLLRRLISLRPGWYVPGFTWLMEAAALILLTLWQDAELLPLALVALTVVALHRFDTIYRRRFRDSVAAPWVFFLGLGASGRVVAYVVLAAADWLAYGLVALILGWSALFAAEAASAWQADHNSD